MDAILKAAHIHLDKSQKRYNANFDKAIWITLQFSPGDFVHLDRPPKEKHEADDIAARLLHHNTCPCSVLNTKGHTIAVDNDLQDVTSTKRVSLTPRPLGSQMADPAASHYLSPMASTQLSTGNMPRKHEGSPPSPPRAVTVEPCGLPSTSMTTTTQITWRKLPNRIPPWLLAMMKATIHTRWSMTTTGHKFFNHIIPAGVREDSEVVYKVPWSGYGPQNDERDPRENIPLNFIKCYWYK